MYAQVRVLGEAFTPEDEEDSSVGEVSAVWVYQARYRIPLTKVSQPPASCTGRLSFWGVAVGPHAC